MFNNRALSISLVKKSPDTNPDNPTQPAGTDYDEIAQIVMYHANHAAKIVGTLYVGRKLLNTACEIAVIAAHKHL